MKKFYDLKTIVIDNIAINYFYLREKNDINGNARYRVFIQDPDANAVIETIFKCYESQIAEHVKMLVEETEVN